MNRQPGAATAGPAPRPLGATVAALVAAVPEAAVPPPFEALPPAPGAPPPAAAAGPVVPGVPVEPVVKKIPAQSFLKTPEPAGSPWASCGKSASGRFHQVICGAMASIRLSYPAASSASAPP